MSDVARRAVAVVLVVAAVVGGAVGSHLASGSAPAAPGADYAGSIASAAGVTSSAWYCAGTAATPSGAQASVVVTNPTAGQLTGSVTATPSGAAVASQATVFTVAGGGQVAVPLTAAGAVRVIVDGGGAGVLQMASGPLGFTSAPCASATAAHWYFAHGSTAPGRALQVAVTNPLASDAVVDLTFVASNGFTAPPAYQGLPVPAGTTIVENVGDHLPGDGSIATVVTALSGAVVADEVSETGSGSTGGMSIVAGVASPRQHWAFAQNTDLSGGGNAFTVFNPSPTTAHVTMVIGLNQAQESPIGLTVPALSATTVSAAQQSRIPDNTAYSAVFTSGDAPVVVTRETGAPSGSSAPTDGLTAAEPGARDWVLPALAAPATQLWALAVADLADGPVHVTLRVVLPSGRTVPAPGNWPRSIVRGGTFALPAPGAPIGQYPLELQADGPVAVELDPQPVPAPGVVVLPSWPVAGTMLP